MSDYEELRLEVPPEAAGERLDRFAAAASGESRRRVMEAIDRGLVRVDDRRAKKGQPVEAGQVVRLRLPRLGQGPLPQPELPLAVIYEDPAFVVVSKPSGAPTHPLAPGEEGTLANALIARYPECVGASRDPREGGVAHRLDTATSGLVVAARSRQAWEALRSQFSSRTVRKEYLALVAGELAHPVEVDAPIGAAAGTQPRRMKVLEDPRLEDRQGAREAQTFVEVERCFEGWVLVRCTIATGVMHQIRVHLAHLGLPVAGDPLYGGGSPPGLQRLFLHATMLGFAHPITGAPLLFDAELPPELRAVLDQLSS